MVNNIPKISVLVICYKQEDVIRRALDSLIAQKDYIYEICINDDKSPDGTWEIILEYQAKYPDLVKPVQNNPNLGIFQNIEATWKRPTGDLIYQLSGDDECPNGWFESVCHYVLDNQIDYKNQEICIYGDYVQRFRSGLEICYKNDLITKSNALKLKIRKLLSNRSSCFSKCLLDKYNPVSEGRSYSVELTQDSEQQMYAKENYYIPFVGNIYYAGEGVSAHFNALEIEENMMVYNHFLNYCNLNGIFVDKTDRSYVKYMIYYRKSNYILAFIYYICSIDFSLGCRGLQVNRILNVLRRKIVNKRHNVIKTGLRKTQQKIFNVNGQRIVAQVLSESSSDLIVIAVGVRL